MLIILLSATSLDSNFLCQLALIYTFVVYEDSLWVRLCQ